MNEHPLTRGMSTHETHHEWGGTGKLVRAERVILVRHGESMGNVDEGVRAIDAHVNAGINCIDLFWGAGALFVYTDGLG
jgi:hypothetical protein